MYPFGYHLKSATMRVCVCVLFVHKHIYGKGVFVHMSVCTYVCMCVYICISYIQVTPYIPHAEI